MKLRSDHPVLLATLAFTATAAMLAHWHRAVDDDASAPPGRTATRLVAAPAG